MPQPAALLDEQNIRKAAVGSFPGLLEFLSLPNDALVPGDDMKRNAQWLTSALEKRGFTVRAIENEGRPIVFAGLAQDPARKTILIYVHFDGQPVDAGQWRSPAHGNQCRKSARCAKWTTIDTRLLLHPDFNARHRLFARFASDEKRPLVLFLSALDLLRE